MIVIFIEMKIRIEHLIYISIPCTFLILFQIQPTDDFWRHLISHKYNYTYSDLYLYSNFPSKSLWYGFELVIGIIEPFLKEKSFIFVQTLVTVLFLIGYLKAIEKETQGENIKILFMFIMLYLISERIVLARPSVLVSAIVFILWFIESKAIIRAVLILITPLYWLTFIYVIPFILKDRWVILIIGINLIFWFSYIGLTEYIDIIKSLFFTITDKDINIKENSTIILIFFTFNLIGLIPLFLNYKNDYKTLILILYYTLPNQIRYIENIIPLATSYTRFIKQDIPKVVVYCCIPLLFFGFSGKYKEPIDYKELKFLENKKVLVLQFDRIVFQMAYHIYPIKISPCPELRMTDKEIIEEIRNVNKGEKFRCDLLKRYDFDYIIESKFKKFPKCLDLVLINKEIRVWRVLKESEF